MPEHPDISTLDGEALCRGIMEQMGWHPDVKRADGHVLDTVWFTRDLNAVAKAERILRVAQWSLSVHYWGGREYSAQWSRPDAILVPRFTADTEALARARAVYAGLLAYQSAQTPPERTPEAS